MRSSIGRVRATRATAGALTALLVGWLVACGGGSGNAGPSAVPVGEGGTDGGDSARDATVGVGDAGLPGEDAAPAQLARLVGRVDRRDPAGPRVAWPGSAIVLRFRGTGLDVRLHDTGVDQLAVTIDGAPAAVVKITTSTTPDGDTYAVARGLTDGEHTATLTKRTETFFGTLQLLEATPLESVAGRTGTLLPPPAPRPHLLEVVGDSITCGYGVLGLGPTCPFTADTEDEGSAYGALAAARLGAEHVSVAWSGMGVYRNYDGLSDGGVMPSFWTRTLADDATSAWDFSLVPDVVVVSLGTNDFAKGDPGQPFVSAYAAFVAAIRAHYPAAYIVCATSPLLGPPEHDVHRGYLQTVVDAAHARGDAKVSLLDFDVQLPADGYGCDYHPSRATHAKMSDKLVGHVHALTGF